MTISDEDGAAASRSTSDRVAGGDAQSTAAGDRDRQRSTATDGTDGDERSLEARRREAIRREVAVVEDAVGVRTLANRVAAREYEPAAASSAFQQRQRVFVSLKQTHLPSLAEDGIVTYEPSRGLVGPGPRLQAASTGPIDGEDRHADDERRERLLPAASG